MHLSLRVTQQEVTDRAMNVTTHDNCSEIKKMTGVCTHTYTRRKANTHTYTNTLAHTNIHTNTFTHKHVRTYRDSNRTQKRSNDISQVIVGNREQFNLSRRTHEYLEVKYGRHDQHHDKHGYHCDALLGGREEGGREGGRLRG